MATNAYVCPSCLLQQDTKDGFCHDCGTQLILLRYCDSCGVKARGAEDFCRECGTRLPEATPFDVIPPGEDKKSGSGASATTTTPAWIQENEPAPAPIPASRRSPPIATATRTKDDTPEWLRSSNKRVDDSILTPRPVPQPPAARPKPVASNSPVLVRRPVSTSSDNRTRNLQALLGLIFAVVGVALASPTSIVFSLAMIVIAMVVGGKPLLEITTAGFHRIVDWIWEDPVLRKRMLDE